MKDSTSENGSLEAAVKTTSPVINNIPTASFVLPLFAAIVRPHHSASLQPKPNTRCFRFCSFRLLAAVSASMPMTPYAASNAEQYAVL